MNFEKYTTKSQQVVQKSIKIASESQQTIVDTAHLLRAILEETPHIISFIHQKLEIQDDHLTGALNAIISNQVKSSGSDPSFSNKTVMALNKAQDYLKEFGDDYVAVEHILLGILNGSDATTSLMKDAGYKKKLLIEAIKELRQGEKVTDQNTDSNYRSLEKYSINLNQKAKDGKIDPVIGRDEEIRRVLQILSRRTKNNPVLIGEPGVGKTAIIEGLAQRIIQGDVPENLKSKTIFSLDMGLLVAGAKYKGEFEERLKSVIKEAQNSGGEIVLFIDEIHTLIGAGGGEGAMDAANLLKPALARGELLAIGATTLDEYQKHIEKDKALERRFQTILIDEPTEEDAISILRGIKDKYELHHGIRIQDDAVIASVKLSTRYIADRFLPDKAIDLMDEAAAKIRLEIDSMPEELDEIERRVLQLEIEREAIRREKDKDKEAFLNKEMAHLVEERDRLKAQWKNEKDQIQGVTTLKESLEKLHHAADTADRAGDYGKVAELR
jgi:ATP-dependent Clp protease ATP-binding subunit ClpB